MNIKIEELFLTILSAEIAKTRLTNPNAQKSLVTNAMDFAEQAMEAIQARVNPVEEQEKHPRQELADALGLSTEEDKVVVDQTEIAQILEGSSDAMTEGGSI